MSKPAKSVLVFGIYLALTGLTLIFVPNLLLKILAVPETREVWIHALGAVTLILGIYYIQAARAELVPFFRWTVWGRPIFFVAVLAFVLTGMAPPILIVFGLLDLSSAIWTAMALRSNGEVRPRENAAAL